MAVILLLLIGGMLNSTYVVAVKYSDKEIDDFLIENGESVKKAGTVNDGETVLHRLAMKENLSGEQEVSMEDMITSIVNRWKININSSHVVEGTSLHLAVSPRDQSSVISLIKNGANVNAVSNKETPLHRLAKKLKEPAADTRRYDDLLLRIPILAHHIKQTDICNKDISLQRLVMKLAANAEDAKRHSYLLNIQILVDLVDQLSELEKQKNKTYELEIEMVNELRREAENIKRRRIEMYERLLNDIQVLVNYDASPYVFDNEGNTPLHILFKPPIESQFNDFYYQVAIVKAVKILIKKTNKRVAMLTIDFRPS
ncbi:MAG: ankyrin repeat domain-containing protein [Coxiellaceae bacterium]|nr:ankyrin repeat domain-containing protein [Coxiellaceae bacterium]